MGIIADKLNEDEKYYIHFQDFIQLLSDFSGDTNQAIAMYLLKSEEFLKLNFYSTKHNGLSEAIEYDAYEDDEPSSMPIEDFMRDVAEDKDPFHQGVRETDPWYKAFCVEDILEVECIKEIGLDETYFKIYNDMTNPDIKAEMSKLKATKPLLQGSVHSHYKSNSLSKSSLVLSSRKEQSYLATIGLLLELLKKPKGLDSKSPFPSQASIIYEIIDEKIYGQSKANLEIRFSEANQVLKNFRK